MFRCTIAGIVHGYNTIGSAFFLDVLSCFVSTCVLKSYVCDATLLNDHTYNQCRCRIRHWSPSTDRRRPTVTSWHRNRRQPDCSPDCPDPPGPPSARRAAGPETHAHKTMTSLVMMNCGRSRNTHEHKQITIYHEHTLIGLKTWLSRLRKWRTGLPELHIKVSRPREKNCICNG